MQLRTVETERLTVGYAATGPASGRPVVLLHGFPTTSTPSTPWAALEQDCRASYRVRYGLAEPEPVTQAVLDVRRLTDQ